MSQEEQDSIYGRLMRESREAKKTVAALEAKLSSSAAIVQHCALNLSALSHSDIDLDIEFMRNFDRDSILQTVSELRDARKTVERLATQLGKFEQ